MHKFHGFKSGYHLFLIFYHIFYLNCFILAEVNWRVYEGKYLFIDVKLKKLLLKRFFKAFGLTIINFV